MYALTRAGSPASPGLRIVLWLAAALMLVVGSLLTLQTARAAATINVTSTADGTNPALYACPATIAMPCTLRLAITTANNTTGDTVAIPAGTYTLTMHQELQIRAAMNLVGADPRTTIIDGDAANTPDARIINVLGTSIDVGISNLTLQHASYDGNGGAVYDTSNGTVTLTNDAIVHNTISNSGALYGAGVFTATEGSTHLVINRSLIADNHAPHGTDTSSTDYSEGGGLFVGNSANATVTNSTITGNSSDAGGGIFTNTGNTILVNDTIAGNTAAVLTQEGIGGGGVTDESSGTTLTNTIVSGNTNGDCRLWFGVPNGGSITSGGHNIDGDGTCQLTATGDKPSTNPKLAALALNAPGQTSTMAIDNTSPAWNTAGAAACPATDQRGVTRPQGPACDIGAYELILVVPTPSPSATPALPKAGQSSPSGGAGTGLILVAIALLLAPLAVGMARRRYPDDIRAS